MSADKYLCIFSREMETIVYLYLNVWGEKLATATNCSAMVYAMQHYNKKILVRKLALTSDQQYHSWFPFFF